MLYPEFSAEPLSTPVTYSQIQEGEYTTASAEEESHVISFGFITCKAISLYNRSTRAGVFAHLGYTKNAGDSLATIAGAYKGDLATADVRIAQATTCEEVRRWPTIESIADYFMQFSPRSLMIDRNQGQGPVRGIAFDLRDGELYRANHTDAVIQASTAKPGSQYGTPIYSSWTRFL